MLINKNELSAQELIDKYASWIETADILELNVLDCDYSELYGCLLVIFTTKLDILNTLNITASQLLDFFIDVKNSYQDTPYHSFYHATDVVVVLYYVMFHLKAKKYFTSLELTILFISAICHDAGHTGYNNDYHIKLNTDLAKRLKSKSVLESLSVEITLELLKKHDILQQYPEHLSKIEQIILSTDMQKHYHLLTEMNSLEDILSSVNLWDEDDEVESSSDTTTHSSMFFFESLIDDNLKEEETSMISNPLDEEQRHSFACILLHAADISNTVRSWPISKQWSDLIVKEFFRQGDAEKAAQLTVSPGMDRDVATQPSISLKFIDFIIKPYFDALTGLLPSAKVLVYQLQENRDEWAALKQGPLASSISTYFMMNHSTKRHVSVPAGTVSLSPDLSSSTTTTNRVKPMPIFRPRLRN